jgi:hypothetical protein
MEEMELLDFLKAAFPEVQSIQEKIDLGAKYSDRVEILKPCVKSIWYSTTKIMYEIREQTMEEDGLGLFQKAFARQSSEYCYKNLYKRFSEGAEIAYSQAEALIRQSRLYLQIPPDYRYPLAVSTMIKFIENGRADNWVTVVEKYEEQLHRWTMEKNSAEALEYSKFTAMKSGDTARNTGISAAFSIANFFLK